MAGLHFEYDEKGNTFFYFLLSFFALILLPVTYYLWPSTKQDTENKEENTLECHCENCQVKRQKTRAEQPWDRTKKALTKFLLILAWIFFMLLVYKVSTLEADAVEYDPYTVLQIDRGSTIHQIKKQYRKLSLIHHPDKEHGDETNFMRIAKAYAALTDEESRKNWEEYGNPDGPGVTRFGIALPKWIIEDKHSIWVLAVYVFLFMFLLPICVGTWWYRSIKFSGDQVLLDTTQLYFIFFHKTPNMILKRLIMILGASMEFEKTHNNEIQERPSDNVEIPLLLKEMPQINIKNKERPLCFPYSVKARALLHAHFTRLELPPHTLDYDKQYILRRCPYLIAEMINVVTQLVFMANSGRVPHPPKLDTIENIMRLSAMIIQAMWENKNPLLQLPHITEDMLRHFTTRKRNVRNIRDFVRLSENDRRSLLRTLNDHYYNDVITVCRMLPHITMTSTCEVMDDEDKTITAGSLVTVTVELKRISLWDFYHQSTTMSNEENITAANDANIFGNLPTNCSSSSHQYSPAANLHPDNDDGLMTSASIPRSRVDPASYDGDNNTEMNGEIPSSNAGQTNKIKPWEKNRKKFKSKSKKRGGTGRKPQSVAIVHNKLTNHPTAEVESENGSDKRNFVEDISLEHSVTSAQENNSDIIKEDDAASSDSTPKLKRPLAALDDDKNEDGSDLSDVSDDEDDWQKFQEEAKKENFLETKPRESHPVHCPYFPVERQENWWVYVCDRRTSELMTVPVTVSSLKDEEEVSLKFPAPPKPGNYQYTVSLRSDSYFDFDQTQTIKLDVKEAKQITSHKQWEFSDDEDDEGEHVEGGLGSGDFSSSDYSSDEDISSQRAPVNLYDSD